MADDDGFWQQCLSEIRGRIKPKSFDTWFAESHAQIVEGELLRVSVTSTVAADWLQSHYSDLIEEVAFKVVEQRLKVTYELREAAVESTAPPVREAAANTELLDRRTQADGESGEDQPPLFTFNEDYVFESYVVGGGNRLAHAAAMAIIDSPANMRFNPLFIFGGPGLGKTHLLHAIGNKLSEVAPNARVQYVTAEGFMQGFIEALKTRSTREFKSHYRSGDYLLVDDVQFLLRGEHTQNEFFHTFNELHQSGRQIVMTCDRPPEKLEGAEDRLISRFKWGLVSSIEAPDLESRTAIVKRKAARSGIELGDAVAVYLANFAKGNVRELEGALNALMAYCVVGNMEMSVQAAQKVLRRRGDVAVGAVEVGMIQSAVAKYFGVTVELMIGRSRKQEIAAARHVAMYIARQLTGESHATIGMCFGKRDHSTVVHATKVVERRLQTEPRFSEEIQALTNELTSPDLGELSEVGSWVS